MTNKMLVTQDYEEKLNLAISALECLESHVLLMGMPIDCPIAKIVKTARMDASVAYHTLLWGDNVTRLPLAAK